MEAEGIQTIFKNQVLNGLFVMHTWKRNVISDLFAVLLELLRIIPSDLQRVHHLLFV